MNPHINRLYQPCRFDDMWIQSKLSSLADGRVLKVVNISQDWMRRESERMGWDRGKGWLGYWVDSGVLRLPLSTRWQWSPVAMETLQSSFHCTHKLLVSSPTPPISLPFHPVQQIEECQSAVWVSRRAKPGSALPQNDRAGWVVGRESGRKQCGGGQRK